MPGHVSVPVVSLLDPVSPGQGLRKMLQQAGAGEGLAVDGNQARLHRLEPLVQIQAHRDAPDAVRGGPQPGDILFQPVKTAVLPDGVDSFPQPPQAFGGQLPVPQAVLHGLHRGDIIPQLVQPVDQVPDAHPLVGGPADRPEIVQEFDVIQQLHHLLPNLRMMKQIVKYVRPEARDLRLRRHAAENLEQHGLLLRLRRHFPAQRVQPQVVHRFIAQGTIGDPILKGEENRQLFPGSGGCFLSFFSELHAPLLFPFFLWPYHNSIRRIGQGKTENGSRRRQERQREPPNGGDLSRTAPVPH